MTTKSKTPKPAERESSIPRQVRMPADLDRFLEQEAASEDIPKTVADKIREICAAYRKAKQQDQAA